MVIFRRGNDETFAVFDGLPKLVNLLRPVGAVLIFIVKRQLRIQNVEGDLIRQVVAQAHQCAARKRGLSQAAG